MSTWPCPAVKQDSTGATAQQGHVDAMFVSTKPSLPRPQQCLSHGGDTCCWWPDSRSPPAGPPCVIPKSRYRAGGVPGAHVAAAFTLDVPFSPQSSHALEPQPPWGGAWPPTLLKAPRLRPACRTAPPRDAGRSRCRCPGRKQGRPGCWYGLDLLLASGVLER